MGNVTENKSPRNRIERLDFARMIAIILVVLCHAVENVYALKLDYISSISVQSKIFAFYRIYPRKNRRPLLSYDKRVSLIGQSLRHTEDSIRGLPRRSTWQAAAKLRFSFSCGLNPN